MAFDEAEVEPRSPVFEETPHIDGRRIMQSIFSPAARRNTLRESGNLDRRDGELKMDWTKPLARRPPYGF